jgi:predicted kinase
MTSLVECALQRRIWDHSTAAGDARSGAMQIGRYALAAPTARSIHNLLAMALTDNAAMVLITGIPAAGKSTVADRLARRFRRGVHVRGDVFRRMVVTGRHGMTATPSQEAWRQLRLRYRLAAQAADAYYEAGFSVVVQDVVIGPELTTYVNGIRARPLVLVVLAPRPEVVARREVARTKVAYSEDGATITALDSALRQETPRIGLWIDTSTQSPDETVAEIIRRGPTDGRID